MSTLQIDGVFLEFDNRIILSNVHLKVQSGEVCGILGSNGCGKSCLLQVIFGALTPKFKSLKIDDRAILVTKRRPEDMRYLPQFNILPNNLRLKQLFQYFGTSIDQFIIHFPDFKDRMDLKVGQLSGGQKRVLEVFLILTCPTKFCLLDEPFTHLMPMHLETVKALIKKESHHKGIIITDHMFKHLIDCTDKIYVLKDGSSYLTKNLDDIERLGYARVN